MNFARFNALYIALIRPRVDDVICFRLETKGFVSLRASPGYKGLCLLKGSCFHPETKTFVSFDVGGGSTDMMSQRVHGNKDHCQRKPRSVAS